MSDHVYKVIELVGSSPNGMEDAVRNAVDRASETVRNMRWLEVTQTRGHIENGRIAHWQVGVKIGFTLDDSGDAPVETSRSPRSGQRRTARRRSR